VGGMLVPLPAGEGAARTSFRGWVQVVLLLSIPKAWLWTAQASDVLCCLLLLCRPPLFGCGCWIQARGGGDLIAPVPPAVFGSFWD